MGATLAQRTWALPRLAAGCLALGALSLLLHAAPTYDPWSWLVWGREVGGLELDTAQGPAFKPLPVALATLLSPLGDAAVWVWLALARAGALFAAVLAWRLAARFTGGSALAGAVAAAGVLLTEGWLRHAAVGNSEGLFLALVLLALLRGLDGHHRQAFALAALAALLRTEAWPFLALYGVWLWRREPAARALVGGTALLLPVVWLGPDLIAAGDALRSSERARIPNPGAPALAARPALESLARALASMPLLVPAGVALAAAGARRRELPRVALLPAAAALAWIALVALMSELGYSGEQRYAMPGVALLAVSAGAGVAWAAARLPQRARTAVAVGVALMLVGGTGGLAADVRYLDHQAGFDGGADDAVAAAGGREAVLSCRPTFTAPYSRPAMAWALHVPISALSTETAHGGTVFRTRPFRDAPVGPPLDAPGSYTETARAGDWRVLERCAEAR